MNKEQYDTILQEIRELHKRDYVVKGENDRDLSALKASIERLEKDTKEHYVSQKFFYRSIATITFPLIAIVIAAYVGARMGWIFTK